MSAAPVERVVAGEVQPSRTQAGTCHSCGRWSDHARVVAEIDRDSGAGAIVLRCPACDQHPMP